jgi:predicted metal-dependent phosphoesterase TrpH
MQAIDLHFHSTASDGSLSPTAVIERAANHAAKVVALTDHDTLAGVAEAAEAATRLGIGFVVGAELSVTWQQKQLHIVGLGMDLHHQPLNQHLARIRNGRVERARKMAADLERHLDITGVLAGAMRYVAGGEDTISRAHFARYLVEIGIVNNVSSVFKRYLTKGRPGYIDHEWASLEQAVQYIKQAGGKAVIAHPARYELTRILREQLIIDFKACGGEGIEVCSSSHDRNDIYTYGRIAEKNGLLASSGSDFHAPSEGFHQIGQTIDLPEFCEPIWPHLNTIHGQSTMQHLQ